MCTAAKPAAIEELEGLLLRETIEEPDEADLVGKAKPVMRAPSLAELHETFLGQAGGSLELVAGKHHRCDTANAEARKDGSLAHIKKRNNRCAHNPRLTTPIGGMRAIYWAEVALTGVRNQRGIGACQHNLIDTE